MCQMHKYFSFRHWPGSSISEGTHLNFNRGRVTMIGRFTHLFKKRAEKSAMRKKVEAMFSSKEEVNINGNGTSGYTVKAGANKGKILGHVSKKSTNNW